MGEKSGERTTSLAEGAERFEAFIHDVKARQISETHNAPMLKTAADPFNLSPGELWSRKYMTTAIGPMAVRPSDACEASVAFHPAGEIAATATLNASRETGASKANVETTIGAALAKPLRRPSWLGRLIGRRLRAPIWSKSSVFCRADKGLARRSPTRKDLSATGAFGISCGSD